MRTGAVAPPARDRAGYVGLLTRARVRSRWQSPLGLVVLLGVVGGLSLFSVAGARRVQSAYPRYLRDGNASTVSVAGVGGFEESAAGKIAAFPEVAQSRTWIALQTFALVDGRPDPEQDFDGVGTFDGRYFDQDRVAVTHGRMPDPDEVDEVLVNQLAVDAFGYRLGQRIPVGAYSLDQISDPAFFESPPPPVRTTTVRIVGIGLFPDEVVQDDADRATRILYTPAFTRANRAAVSYAVQGLVLRGGDRDIQRVAREVGTVYPIEATELRVTSVDTFHTQQAIRPLAVALALFGVLAGLAALVLVGQGIVRSVRWDAGERAVLRALGVAPRGLVASGLVMPVATAVLGAGLAVVLAVAASPAMPIGPVRAIEVDAGLQVDWLVLGLGALTFTGVLVTIAVLALRSDVARRDTRSAGSSRSVARLLTIAAHRGVGPRALTGLRFAVANDPDGSSSGRSVVVGAAVAIAALVAAVTFGASLHTLVTEPRLYGWNWDAAVVAGDGYGNIDRDAADELLGGEPDVAQWSGAYFGADRIGGRFVPLLGMDPGAVVAPPLLEGRALGGDREVVLGPTTASQLGLGVGDRLTLASRPGEPLEVVGIATFPTIGAVHVAHTSLGVGALVVPSRVPGFDRSMIGELGQDLGPRTYFVRFRPGTDVDRAVARLDRSVQPLGDFGGIHASAVQRPAEIVNSDSLGNAPVLLASGLAVGAMLSLGLALAAAVRRRRRELALLKALGFTPGDAGAAVAWQATVTTGVGLLIGVPVGMLVGRLLWSRFAAQLDVVDQATVPWATIAGIALVALALANLIAAVPARRARRTETALLLRAE